MTTSDRSWGFWLCSASWLAMGGVIASSGDLALAQITPDATLGAESSVVTPNAGGVDVISGGATRGVNLFHSFDAFSVPTGGVAYFNNGLDIQNIISRVTGGSISNIDGLIRANGTANVFLLNPNGIIFGPNAQLNIGGSFLGSTASSLNFADGRQFSATAHSTTPLLTVSVPIGLQYGGTAGSILNQSQAINSSGELVVGLRVQPGKTLALVGGDVAIKGGNLTAEGGRIELGSVAGTGLVSLTPMNKGWALGYEGVQNFQDIQLSQQAVVDASGERGGDIQLSGRRIALTDTSSIDANNLGSQNGGKISIQASELIAQNGSQVTASTLGAGQGGDLSVTAEDSVELSGTSVDGQISSGLFTQTQGIGAAGDLKIATRQLLVQDGAQVTASTLGAGQGGDLSVTAEDSVELIGSGSGLFAQASPGSNGASGDLTITTNQLTVRDGALVAASSVGLGEAGTIQLTAGSIQMENLGAITATTASGNGGNITLQAQDLLLLPRNSNIDAKAGTAGAGENGGNISIITETVPIPEPSPTLGILAFTAFSAAKVLKRKQKKHKCRANIS